MLKQIIPDRVDRETNLDYELDAAREKAGNCLTG